MFFSLLWFCCLGALTGCAAPGEPTPQRPVVPEAIKDLAARQAGNTVVLTFTLPKSSIDAQPLAELPAVEIYRGSAPPGGAQGKLSTRLVYTIPGALVETYLSEGRVKFSDPQHPEDLAAQAGGQMVYMVRTRVSRRRGSADSNVVALRVYPAPERIGDVRAEVTETAVGLSWSPPQHTFNGPALGSLVGYRIYRAEVEPGGEEAAARDPSKAKLKTPLELLGPAATPAFRDTQFEFGRAYLYSVRSVAQYESDSVESDDSLPVVVAPRDTFPPTPPLGLVVVSVPAMGDASAYLELSWSISSETDLAGYHVYRSEQGDPRAGGRGERLTRELLLSPTFRDMSVAPGRRYTYRVTAVDRAGNESPPSTAVSAEAPPPEP